MPRPSHDRPTIQIIQIHHYFHDALRIKADLNIDLKKENHEEKKQYDMGLSISIFEHTEEETMPTTVEATTSQYGILKINPTYKGKPAKLDGVPVWTVLAGDCTVEPAPDGMSAKIYDRSAGTNEIGIKADADMGDGYEEISDTVTWIAEDPKADSLGLALDGELQDLPEEPPTGGGGV